MSSSEQKELHIRETSNTASEETNPRVKPQPRTGKISVPFSYTPSDDGTDENLLILLHGLGDTHVPFSKLGKQLKLPQTAVLALRAPEQIPFLYEEAYQWYPSFDQLGELISNPNPSTALELLTKVTTYLTTECKWPLHSIHFFGFAQGGTVAAEFSLHWWREKQLSENATQPPTTSFGSVITIAGPLISFPSTLSSPSPTPLLAICRPAPSELTFISSNIAAFKKGYGVIREEKYVNVQGGMPTGKNEWEPVMRFWSERLGRRIAGSDSGLYEVLNGFS